MAAWLAPVLAITAVSVNGDQSSGAATVIDLFHNRSLHNVAP